MKYIEDEDLVEGAFYHCLTYNNEDIIIQYFGDGLFAGYLSFEQIRYVLEEYPPLNSDKFR